MANAALIVGLTLEVAWSSQPVPACVGSLLIGLSIALNDRGIFQAARDKRQ